jgi:hypothetical protein
MRRLTSSVCGVWLAVVLGVQAASAQDTGQNRGMALLEEAAAR